MRDDQLTPVFTDSWDSSDSRGFSYSIPSDALDALPRVSDVHIASIEPGSVRGNHFHLLKWEVISISHSAPCAFVWDEGEGTEIRRKDFSGTGSVAVVVPPGGSHAVWNTGDKPLQLVVLSDQAYDPDSPDACHRTVVDGRLTP